MRIVAVSDLHGFLPVIPPCDLLLVGGDICPDRIGLTLAHQRPEAQQAWFDRYARAWFAGTPAAHRIATWGNHDWCGERCDFSRDAPGCASTRTLQIVEDRATTVVFDGATPPITVWATPWSNAFADWAFMKTPDALATLYAAIPAGIDILMAHQPPYGYGDRLADRSVTRECLGSRELLATIERVRPRIVVCGHIHAGHGRYDHQGVPIYNVSVVDEQYRPAHAATVIDL